MPLDVPFCPIVVCRHCRAYGDVCCLWRPFIVPPIIVGTCVYLFNCVIVPNSAASLHSIIWITRRSFNSTRTVISPLLVLHLNSISIFLLSTASNCIHSIHACISIRIFRFPTNIDGEFVAVRCSVNDACNANAASMDICHSSTWGPNRVPEAAIRDVILFFFLIILFFLCTS